jgi:hypothetical protein
MILRQFLHRDPVAISYLLGCVGHGAGAVVDPLFPIEPYPVFADSTWKTSVLVRIRFDKYMEFHGYIGPQRRKRL